MNYWNNLIWTDEEMQEARIESYNDAIDDFKEALLENDVNTSVVRRLAEQLKKGGENETN